MGQHQTHPQCISPNVSNVPSCFTPFVPTVPSNTLTDEETSVTNSSDEKPINKVHENIFEKGKDDPEKISRYSYSVANQLSRKQDQPSWIDSFVDDFDEDNFDMTNILAGGMAGLVSELMMHPLETISHRAKMHPQSFYGGIFGSPIKILREEGPRGIVAGWSVTAMIAAPQTAAYFGLYHLLKEVGISMSSSIHDTDSDTHETVVSPAIILCAGGFAELFSSSLFIPCEVVKSRLQLGKNPNRATGGLIRQTSNFSDMFSAVDVIAQREGVKGLFAGWGSCMVLDMCFSALQFLFYEYARRRFEYSAGREPLVPEIFWLGGCAGALAATFTNPLDVITTRLMAQGEHKPYGTGMISVGKAALREGPIGLWRGTFPRMLSAFPYVGLQFAAFEYFRRWFFPWSFIEPACEIRHEWFRRYD